MILLSPNRGHADQDPARRHVQAVVQKPASRSDLFAALQSISGLLEAPTQRDSSAPAPPQRAMRVLAAEDNRTNRLVFSKMVKTLDVELEFAKDGAQAVDLYQAFVPDIVFMDISMPGMDGKEATGKIRALEDGRGTHVPIVAMTAHAMDGDEAAILQAGLDHYLTKPLRKAAIVEQIIAAQPDHTRDPRGGDQSSGGRTNTGLSASDMSGT